MKKLLFLLPLTIVLASAFTTVAPTPEIPDDIKGLLDKNSCTSCHAMDRKLVGPSWMDISEKGYDKKKIAALVAAPKPAHWPGYPPMAAQKIPKGEMNKIAAWLVSLKQ